MTSLQKLGTSPNLQLTQQLKNASNEALNLSNHLRNAFNQETGQLDLVTFNNSLKKSGKSLTDYAKELSSLGPTGQKAFMDVASAITKAELPMKRTSKLMNELWVTMKNTMRWQLTSSAMHGFMGALSTAYGYCQDLNESLNNIQIVTEKNNAAMAKFAEQANKAAKQLSTTTTGYTDAALIYYQQGLSDQQVLERTNATIKLANVAGESAETASQQLTAVWNNFDDGSKSLEYYADVMTALGAATASSTQEISQGLEKFAAIADTVGLSYEYATTALATITAETRQSADVVGTSLKTLFARIQGLQQDETQEDGTDLNKYSEALANVGINIKTTSGDLKDMDTILNEMAGRWQTLSNAQQLALAQTVAGVRQYTQLIALMDNWDKFQENLVTAQGAEGTLDKQADIYANSWEAARKRVRAAAEDIYDSLINEDFFIGLDNAFTPFLSGIATAIDALGGMKGALSAVGLIMTRLYGDKMAESIRNIATNIKIVSGVAGKEARDTQQEAVDNAGNMEFKDAQSDEDAQRFDMMQKEAVLQGEINKKIDELDDTTKQTLQNEELKLKIIKEQREAILKNQEALKEQQQEYEDTLDTETRVGQKLTDEQKQQLSNVYGRAHTEGIRLKFDIDDKTDVTFAKIKKQIQQIGQQEGVFKSIQKSLQDTNTTADQLDKQGLKKIQERLKNVGINLKDDQIVGFIKNLDQEIGKSSTTLRFYNEVLQDLGYPKEAVVGFINNIQKLTETEANAVDMQDAFNNQLETVNGTLQEGASKKDWADMIVDAGEAVSTLSMAWEAFQSLGNAFTNEDMTAGERLVTIFTALSMLIPVVTGAMGALKTIQAATTNETVRETIANTLNENSKRGQVTKAGLLAIAKKLNIKLTSNMTKATMEETIAKELNMEKTKDLTIAEIADAAAKQKSALQTGILTAGTKIYEAVTGKVVVGTLSFGAALGTVLVTMIAVTAAIVAVVAILKLAYDEYNKDAIAAEKAAETAQNLAAAYNEIKQEYESMIETMEQYQTAREGLDSLTKGTQEYKEALDEANHVALELIDTLGLIKGQDYTVEDGEIKIKESALEQAQKEKYTQVQNMQTASLIASSNADRLQARADQTAIEREYQKMYVAKDTASMGYLERQNQGTASTGIGYGGQANREESIGTQYLGPNIDKLIADYQKLGEEAFENFDFGPVSEEFKESVKELARSARVSGEELETATQIAVSGIIEEEESTQNSANKDKIIGAGTRQYQQAYNEQYDIYNAKKSQDIAAAYAQQAGLADRAGYGVKEVKKDGNVIFKWLNDQGQEETQEVTKNQMAILLATTEATEHFKSTVVELDKTFNTLESSTDVAQHGLADFLSGGTIQSTQSETAELQAKINAQGKGSDLENAQAYLETTLQITDEIAKQRYGYESVSQMAQALVKDTQNTADAWGSIDQRITTSAFAENMSLETAQSLENTLEKISYGPLGRKAGEDFISAFESILGDLNTEDQQAALAEIANIDWTQQDAGKQAIAVMKEYGIAVDETSAEWQDLITKMRMATNATPNYTQLIKDMQKVSGLIAKLDFGSVISEEDYQALVDYKEEWADLFQTQADGTKKFIGNSDDMAQAVRADMQAQREDLAEKQKLQEAFKNSKFGWEQADGSRKLVNFATAKGSETNIAKGLLDDSDVIEDLLESKGYTDDVITDMLNRATTGTQKEVEEAQKEIETMYRTLAEELGVDYEALIKQSEEAQAATAQNMADLFEMVGDISNEAIEKQITVFAQSAKSLDELQNIRQDAAEMAAQTGNKKFALDSQEYGEALVTLGGNFDNCKKEIEEYRQALLTGSDAQIAAAQTALEASIQIGELSKKFDFDADATENYAKRLKAADKEQKMTLATAGKLAIQNQRLDRGLSNLNDNLEDYKKSLAQNDKQSAEWSKTMDSVKTDLADILNFDDLSMITDEFAENTIASDDFKAALDGDVEALLRLRAEAANDLIVNIVAKQSSAPEEVLSAWRSMRAELDKFDDIDAPEVDQTELIRSFNHMIEAGNMTKEQIESTLAGLNIGAEIHTDYVKQAQTIPTTITEELAEESGFYYQHLYDGQFNTQPIKIPLTRKKSVTYQGEPVTVFGYVPKYSIKGTKGPGGVTKGIIDLPAPKISRSSTTSGKAADKKGGGSSTPSKISSVSKDKKDNITERYLNIKSSINDNTRALERFNKVADDAWGSKKIKNMAMATQLLQRQAKYYSMLANEAAGYMEKDLAAIANNENITSSAYNLQNEYGMQGDFTGIAQKFRNMLTFNEDKTVANMENVLNYGQSLLDPYWQQYQSELEAYNTNYAGKDESDASKAAKESLDKRKGIYELWKSFVDGEIDAVKQYDETANEAYEALQNAVESIRDWMTSKVDRLKTQIEVILTPNQRDLARLERISGQFGDAARQLGYSTDLSLKQIAKLQEQNDTYALGIKRANQILANIETPENVDGDTQTWFTKTFGAEAWNEYLEGNGAMPEQVMGYLTETRDALEQNLYAITDLAMTELDNAYADIDDWFTDFNAMIEKELAKASSTIDYYQAVTDWIDPDKITSSQQAIQRALNEAKMEQTKASAITTVDQAEAAQVAMEKAQKELEVAQNNYNAAIRDNDTANAQFWGGAIARHKEAYDKYKEEFESYSQSAIEGVTELFTTAQEVLESQKKMARNALGVSMGGLFTTVDQISEVYDSIKDYQSLYLDDYDKTYELNTLQRTFDKDIEKSGIDLDAYPGLVKWQEKLNTYKAEGVKLTEQELTALQAEYDYQKAMAELAMEEDAKNAMRLTRDESGNYSYVYYNKETSSGEDPEQKAADAEKRYRDAIDDAQEYFEDSIVNSSSKIIAHLDAFSEELYARSPEYRQWFDSQLDMLLTEYDAAHESTNQMFNIMGESADGLRTKYEETALGVLTQTTSMDEAHKTWRDALVGEGYQIGGEPGGYYGAMIQAQIDMNKNLQSAADEIGDADQEGILGKLNLNFGLTSEHVVGDFAEIQGGITTTRSKLSEESNTIGNILTDNFVSNFNTATTDTLRHLGSTESKADDGSIIGGLKQLTLDTGKMVTDTGISLDNQLLKIESWKTDFVSKFETAAAAVRDVIKAIDELEDREAEKTKKDLEHEINTNGQETEAGNNKPGGNTSGNTTPPPKAEPAPVAEQQPTTWGYTDRDAKIVAYAFGNLASNPETSGLGEKARKYGGIYQAAWDYAGDPSNEYWKNVGGSGWGNIVNWPYDFDTWQVYSKNIRNDQNLNARGSLPGVDVLENGRWIKKQLYTGGLVKEQGIYSLAEEGAELVLNKDDTQNILDAVEMVRQIALIERMLDGNAFAAMSLMADKLSMSSINTAQEPLEQNIHIDHVEFPNVTSSDEIKDAFQTIANDAAQWARRRRD